VGRAAPATRRKKRHTNRASGDRSSAHYGVNHVTIAMLRRKAGMHGLAYEQAQRERIARQRKWGCRPKHGHVENTQHIKEEKQTGKSFSRRSGVRRIKPSGVRRIKPSGQTTGIQRARYHFFPFTNTKLPAFAETTSSGMEVGDIFTTSSSLTGDTLTAVGAAFGDLPATLDFLGDAGKERAYVNSN
jgi:hypothetical protein